MELEKKLRELQAWSLRTFGGDRPLQYNVNHIRSELVEIEADPHDVIEWMDVAILAFDGAMRAGHSPDKVVQAFADKIAIIQKRRYVPRADGLMTHKEPS